MGLPSQSKQVGWGSGKDGKSGGGSSGLPKAVLALLAVGGVAAGGWFGWSMLKPGPNTARADDNTKLASNTERVPGGNSGDRETNTPLVNPPANPTDRKNTNVSSHSQPPANPNNSISNTQASDNDATTDGRTPPFVPAKTGNDGAGTPNPIAEKPIERDTTPPRQADKPERITWTDPQQIKQVPIPDGAPVTVAAQLRSADEAIKSDDLLMAREHYYRLLENPAATEENRELARKQISALNDTILFSPQRFSGDPMTEQYVVADGDFGLSQIVKKLSLPVDYRLIARVNEMRNPDIIRLDQKLKVIRGPFHAEVIKSKFRVDIYSGDPDNRQAWRYVRSFPVGLGEHGSTPTGRFVVKLNSKLVNPFWINPRTGEQFKANDPLNPIGERWIGLQGLGEFEHETGYGLHGTIDPESIGTEKSMGCVRLRDDDIAFVYELLTEKVSIVNIID